MVGGIERLTRNALDRAEMTVLEPDGLSDARSEPLGRLGCVAFTETTLMRSKYEELYESYVLCRSFAIGTPVFIALSVAVSLFRGESLVGLLPIILVFLGMGVYLWGRPTPARVVSVSPNELVLRFRREQKTLAYAAISRADVRASTWDNEPYGPPMRSVFRVVLSIRDGRRHRRMIILDDRQQTITTALAAAGVELRDATGKW